MSSAAAISFNAEFFAPETRTAPRNGAPPRTTKTSSTLADDVADGEGIDDMHAMVGAQQATRAVHYWQTDMF
ncbi:MAG: hypothetical protein WD360_01905 [Nitriliruptoraceae bacterium]